MSSCSFHITGTPAQAGSYTFAVQVADSLNDPPASATITLAINAGKPPKISTTTLNLCKRLVNRQTRMAGICGKAGCLGLGRGNGRSE